MIDLLNPLPAPPQLLDPQLDAQCLALLRTLRQLDGAERQGLPGVDEPTAADLAALLAGKQQRRLVGGLREVRTQGRS